MKPKHPARPADDARQHPRAGYGQRIRSQIRTGSPAAATKPLLTWR